MKTCVRALFCAFGVLVGFGCTSPSERVDRSDVRASVVAGLIAGAEGLDRAQVRTFQADLRSGWAAAYDPADPPGCIPGGLRDAGKTPCTVYLLQRRKTRWAVVAAGAPGALSVPEDAPLDLGAPANLKFLAE